MVSLVVFLKKKKLQQLHVFHLHSNNRSVLLHGLLSLDAEKGEMGDDHNDFKTEGRDFFHSCLEHVELGAGSADTTGVVADDLCNKEFKCFATFWKHICLMVIIKT